MKPLMRFLRQRLKIILAFFTIIATLLIISVAGAFFSLGKRMDETLREKRILQPTEYFAEGPVFRPRSLIDPTQVQSKFDSLRYRSRTADQLLLAGDYSHGTKESCESRAGGLLPEGTMGCFVYVGKNVETDSIPSQTSWLIYDSNGMILNLARGTPAIAVPELHLEPLRFAQYLGTSPLMQERVPLGEIPPACLNAVIAIEDQKFLEHGGFSITGIARAVARNLYEGRKAQGGSTITQQLVKNYFLTSEKSFSRKAREIIMSVMLETRFTKDEILETYLNEIYLGQNGAFRVHGYGSASRYYFSRAATDLSLSDCALLAAIINNPGRNNPWKHPQQATQRRDLVLAKMLDLKMITMEDAAAAKTAPLPSQPGRSLAVETAPYFIDAVRKQMIENNWPLEGAKIYTSMDLEAQQAAQQAVQNHLQRLEASHPAIKKRLSNGKKRLEGLLVSGDPESGLIRAVVGGRNFRMTQFNRAIESRRQVGSIMKPFVYLAALDHPRDDGTFINPTSMIDDQRKTMKFEGQSWSPENYDNKYYGRIPLFFALKNSLNAATVSLGMEVGLSSIIEMARTAGLTSEIKKVPSLMLGSFELAPREVLTASMTFANLGRKPQTSFIRRAEGPQGDILYEHQSDLEDSIDPVKTSILVGMMKQVLISGSGRGATLSGFTHPAAGKTGTTNNNRDTWFMGFTPYVSTVVWVGYDDGTTTGLTGSSGSVPIWADFMKTVATRFPPDDFNWPEGTKAVILNRSDLEALNAIRENDPDSVDLIFREE